jgi:hypothetical protein
LNSERGIPFGHLGTAWEQLSPGECRRPSPCFNDVVNLDPGLRRDDVGIDIHFEWSIAIFNNLLLRFSQLSDAVSTDTQVSPAKAGAQVRRFDDVINLDPGLRRDDIEGVNSWFKPFRRAMPE